MNINNMLIDEFKGQIIDLFEDYLAANDFVLESDDRNIAIEDGEDENELAILYGDLYEAIGDEIESAVRANESQEAVHIAALRGFSLALKMGNCKRGIPADDLLDLNEKLAKTIRSWDD